MEAVSKYILLVLLLLPWKILSQDVHPVMTAAERPTLSAATLPATGLSDDSIYVARPATTLDLRYQRIPRTQLTGAVTSVFNSDFNRGLIHHPMQLIQGRVPGLNIVRPGGDPNDDFVIRLRGLATMQSTTQPLIVIDHFPGASLSGLDPNDIESFVVLRDAASSALYGLRGANGVILITTKKGSADRPSVEYQSQMGMESMAKKLPVMTAAEYRNLPGKTDFGAETDWLEQITRKAGTVVHNLSFSGGSEGTAYRAAVNYRNADGILLNSGFAQLNSRIALQQSALKNRATFRADLSRTTRERQVGFPIAFHHATAADPTMPVYDNTTAGLTPGALYGGYAERDIFDFYNPLSIVEQNRNDQNHVLFTGSISGEFSLGDLVTGLSLSMSYYRQQESSVSSTYFKKTSKFGNTIPNQGEASKRFEQNSNRLFESLVHYERDFGKARISVTGGYSLQKFFDESFGMAGGNFLTDAFTYNNMGAALDFDNGSGDVFSYAQSNKLEALVGSAVVNLRETYFLSTTVRHEGASRLGSNFKRGIFPAASAAVILTNLIDVRGLNLFKLRTGYGVSGNQPERSYLSTAQWGQIDFTYQDGIYKPAYALFQSPNADLRWEEKKEVNIGFEMVLLDSRLSASYDYFSNTAEGLILRASDYPTAPFKWGNIVDMKNRGFEVDLTYAAKNSPSFFWSTGLNISGVRTQMVDMTKGSMEYGQNGAAVLGNLETVGCGCTGFIRVKEGAPVGELWAPVQVGLDETGRQVFADLTGDGYGDGSADRKVVGNALPKFVFGFHNSFVYSDFTLSFLVRAALGHSVVNNNRLRFEGQGPLLPYNIVTTKLYLPDLQGAQISDYYVEKAGYVKLDNLQVAYDIPLSDASSLSNVELSLSVQNLFTFTKYTGLDPEVRYHNTRYDNLSPQLALGTNPLISGLESTSTYPRTRTFSLRIQVKI